MREGCAAAHVRLVDDADGPTHAIVGALLPTEHELWDADRCRLTVLLDPARIKRGLAAHRELGYPLRPGASFRLVVDEGFLDAAGAPLRAGAERRYEVGATSVATSIRRYWAVTVPSSRHRRPLRRRVRPTARPRPARPLPPRGRARRPLVDGQRRVGPEERSWRLAPRDRVGHPARTSSSSIPCSRISPATRSVACSTAT